MTNQSKAQSIKEAKKINFLENIQELGSDVVDSFANDLIKGTSEEFANQLLGKNRQPKFTGDFYAGETIEIDEQTSYEIAAGKKLEKQITFERVLLEEERQLIESKMKDLRMNLYAITREIQQIVASTPQISRQVEIAAIQAPINPGEYHITYFEKLLTFLIDFNKNIEDSIIWLTAMNKKGQKKTFWSLYKQYKGSFLLSGEHFSQRSAG